MKPYAPQILSSLPPKPQTPTSQPGAFGYGPRNYRMTRGTQNLSSNVPKFCVQQDQIRRRVSHQQQQQLHQRGAWGQGERCLDLSGRNLASLNGFIDNRINSLNLSRNMFERVPQPGIMLFLAELDISYNAIRTVQGVSLMYPNLRFLDMSNNNLENIHGIEGLPLLEILKLANNKIKSIPSGTLRLNTNLREIDVSGNLLKDIAELRHLSNLVHLDASNNMINVIPPMNSKVLEKLMMSGNMISTTEGLMNAIRLPKLNELVIDGNPITRWDGLGEWLSEVGASQGKEVLSEGGSKDTVDINYRQVPDSRLLANLLTNDYSVMSHYKPSSATGSLRLGASIVPDSAPSNSGVSIPQGGRRHSDTSISQLSPINQLSSPSEWAHNVMPRPLEDSRRVARPSSVRQPNRQRIGTEFKWVIDGPPPHSASHSVSSGSNSSFSTGQGVFTSGQIQKTLVIDGLKTRGESWTVPPDTVNMVVTSPNTLRIMRQVSQMEGLDRILELELRCDAVHIAPIAHLFRPFKGLKQVTIRGAIGESRILKCFILGLCTRLEFYNGIPIDRNEVLKCQEFVTGITSLQSKGRYKEVPNMTQTSSTECNLMSVPQHVELGGCVGDVCVWLLNKVLKKEGTYNVVDQYFKKAINRFLRDHGEV